MEFDKSRIYSAVNADELKKGDKVIVAYNLYGLKEQVKMFTESAIDVIEVIQDEDYFNRFKIKHGESYPLAYLVERAKYRPFRDTDELIKVWDTKYRYACGFIQNQSRFASLNRCENWNPKTEQKAEKENCTNCQDHEYYGLERIDRGLNMPLIWVRNKSDRKVWLINEFDNRILDYLFPNCEFLDGSPCGVEE